MSMCPHCDVQLLVAKRREDEARAAYIAALQEKERVQQLKDAVLTKAQRIASSATEHSQEHLRKLKFLSR